MKINKPTSLYIHIPFCDHICPYCDFTKLFYSPSFSSEYLKALFSEIDSYQIGKMETIYIGGGTPTTLSDTQFEALLAKISPFLSEKGEFTCEANVENLTYAKLLLMKKYGVNRLSIGIQSTDNKRLALIGRHHTFEDAQKVVKSAQELGFNNINVDLMYGFPGQTLDDLRTDLQNILSLSTQHVSIYSLIVSPGTLFFNQMIKEQNQDDSRLFYDEILKTMRNKGFCRYEISNFALPGHESKHNCVYWHNKQYIGVGLGASGYIGNIRYTNTKSLKKYCKGLFVHEKEEINADNQKEYFLLTHLRLEKGFDIKEYNDLFKEDFIEKNKSKINDMINRNLAKISNGHFMFTDDGLIIMDRLLLELF